MQKIDRAAITYALKLAANHMHNNPIVNVISVLWLLYTNGYPWLMSLVFIYKCASNAGNALWTIDLSASLLSVILIMRMFTVEHPVIAFLNMLCVVTVTSICYRNAYTLVANYVLSRFCRTSHSDPPERIYYVHDHDKFIAELKSIGPHILKLYDEKICSIKPSKNIETRFKNATEAPTMEDAQKMKVAFSAD